MFRGDDDMKKAIIFDMDGTLFQTNLILESALDATFDVLRNEGKWHSETPIDQYRNIMGVPLPVVWETLCPLHSADIHKQNNKIFQQKLIELIQLKRGALYPHVEHVLETLSQTHSLFIASNGQTKYLNAIIETYQLERFIENTYSIELIPSGHKSELVRKIIIENGIESGFVVGDRASDILAAKDNQLVAIGVNFDFAQEAELLLADFIINNFKELPENILKSLK